MTTPREPRTTDDYGPIPSNLHPSLNHHERGRLRAAVYHARRRYPGPVGEVLAAELTSWEAFGYRLGGHSVIARLVDHLMKGP